MGIYKVAAVLEPDHTCFWTRRRTTELSRSAERLRGAGIPLSALRFAAARLGFAVAATPSAENPDTVLLVIGPFRGSLHDGCLFSLEHPDAALQGAILEGVRELHTHYLGGVVAPASAFVKVADLLQDGRSVRIKTRQGRLELITFPTGASWFTRAFSHRLVFGAP
jgi:hypothetical protein